MYTLPTSEPDTGPKEQGTACPKTLGIRFVAGE